MKARIDNILSDQEKAIFGKDFSELWRFGTYRSMLISIALVLAVVFPLLYLVAILATPEDTPGNVTNLALLLPDRFTTLNFRQALYYMLINMICPLLFVLVPLLSAVITASIFFVGEKEKQTALPLLSTCCPLVKIFKAKFFCALLNSILISVVAFVSIAVFAAVGSVLFEVPFYLSATWMVEFFILSPALSIMGILFVYCLSSTCRRIMHMVMSCGYIVLPFILLFIGQFAGFYEITWPFLLGLSLLIVAGDITCLFIVRKRITAEKLTEIGEQHVY